MSDYVDRLNATSKGIDPNFAFVDYMDESQMASLDFQRLMDTQTR